MGRGKRNMKKTDNYMPETGASQKRMSRKKMSKLKWKGSMQEIVDLLDADEEESQKEASNKIREVERELREEEEEANSK